MKALGWSLLLAALMIAGFRDWQHNERHAEAAAEFADLEQWMTDMQDKGLACERDAEDAWDRWHTNVEFGQDFIAHMVLTHGLIWLDGSKVWMECRNAGECAL